jgi:NADH-quinone oxidoreductase subunit J
MEILNIIFYTFSLVSILAASQVVFSRNPVKSVLSLVLCFFSTAVLWMLCESEFLSIVLILVYVGAVMVLFLFVVMMLDVKISFLKEGFVKYLPLGVSIGVLFVLGIVYSITYNTIISCKTFTAYPEGYNNVKTLGEVLFTEYVYPFEVSGIILLVAMIAAISLTFRGTQTRKSQDVTKQIKVKAKERIKLVDIKENE